MGAMSGKAVLSIGISEETITVMIAGLVRTLRNKSAKYSMI